MNRHGIFEPIGTEREFRYSVGFYFTEPNGKNVIAWHNCTNKPLYLSCSDFAHIQATEGACPNCGQDILRWQTMSVSDDRVNEKSVYLHFDFVNLIRISVNGFKISVGIFKSFYNLWKNTAVFAKSTFYNRFTINAETGYTYRYGKVNLSKKGDRGEVGEVFNISYLGAEFDLPTDALNCLKAVIDRVMEMIHGKATPSFESYAMELTFNHLIFYVRNPYICPAMYNIMIYKGRRNPYDIIRLKEIVVKNDCREPLRQILLQSRIPDVKSLRRIAFTNAIGLPLLASLSRTFRNVDIIRSMYDAYIDCCDDEHGAYVDFSAKIFRTMVKHKGEKNIASKILKYKRRDTDNNAYRSLYDMVRNYDELQYCDFDFSKKYSLDELHSYLAASVSKQETQNREIKYEQGQSFLEASDSNFSLSLAKDTHELIRVGADMNICVGSYANMAINRSCTILILRNLENKLPVGCVELRNTKVIQVKGPHNTLLQNQERSFVESWIKDKGLSVATAK